jgi:hypothetical protein
MLVCFTPALEALEYEARRFEQVACQHPLLDEFAEYWRNHLGEWVLPSEQNFTLLVFARSKLASNRKKPGYPPGPGLPWRDRQRVAHARASRLALPFHYG